MKSPEPTVVLFGLTHVGVAPASSGFVPMRWIKGIGPRPLGPITDHDGAVDRARAYVATYPHSSVLDVPEGYDPIERGMIHVDLAGDGRIEVLHEGRSGNSFATLGHFDPSDRKRAIAFALHQRPIYDARLGRLLTDDLCLSREIVR